MTDFHAESIEQFTQRKKDHIQLALDAQNEAINQSGLDTLRLAHEALPELDLSKVSIQNQRIGKPCFTPFLVSSMTAGHHDAVDINAVLAEAAATRGWAMGVGSQRRQLYDEAAAIEWKKIRQRVPDVSLMGNIGLAQLINTSADDIQRLADSLQAEAMIIHTNPLQECLQVEGTPNFKGGLDALTNLCSKLPLPIILKETGCGFSANTLKRLNDTGIAAVDISGLGGTHWGRIEGQRANPSDKQAHAAQTFKNWGISTVQSLQYAIELKPNYAIWGSGGVRSGLDAAKLLALGAEVIGFAKPMLQAALQGVETLVKTMETIEYELKVALFCTGSDSIKTLQENAKWE